jgi:hypothetical protein
MPMGTRADFYIGRGESAEWVGSVAWDGQPSGMPEPLLTATTKGDFLAAVAGMADTRDDFTIPSVHGWPWPWKDSHLTDYSYAFDGDAVYVTDSYTEWRKASEDEPEGDEDDSDWPNGAIECPQCGNPAHPSVVFPLRGGKSQGDIFGDRSGVIVIGL